MSLPNEAPLKKLQFYVTASYACGYLPNQLAQSLIASPQHLVSTEVYNSLIQQGFRRSGKFAYRPHCENCNACTPVRVILSEFTPNRSQRRAYKLHADLNARILPLGYHSEHFELYQAYQATRHAEGHLENGLDDVEQYRQFLCQSNVESLMVEFRDTSGEIKIVSVVDVLADGTSAVYTFYDTRVTQTDDQVKNASYGTYAIMWLLDWTKSLNLPYLYLGYWIAESPKMAYKQNFKPLQKLINGAWQS